LFGCGKRAKLIEKQNVGNNGIIGALNDTVKRPAENFERLNQERKALLF
jgi:hypothetical protein